MPQTMLLTKRLTAFLNSNTSSHLHTLLLLSPTGKLLATSSPLPASTLRTQATLACTLWDQYTFEEPTVELMSSALSLTLAAPDGRGRKTQEISTIMIQLEYGIMVVQGLQSGLIFVAIGPSSSIPGPRPHIRSAIHSPNPPSSPPPNTDALEEQEQMLGSPLPGSLTVTGGGSGAPSEAGSVGTTGSGTAASILGLKRHAEELARWLDKKLEGFSLGPADMR